MAREPPNSTCAASSANSDEENASPIVPTTNAAKLAWITHRSPMRSEMTPPNIRSATWNNPCPAMMTPSQPGL